MSSEKNQGRVVYLFVSTVLSIALTACGGASHSTMSTSSANVTGSASGGASSGTTSTSTSNTATAGSGAAGTSSSGSSSGTSGSTGSSSGTSGGSSSTGATYVYGALYANGGGVVGYSQNSSAMLTAVGGSPYVQQGAAGMSSLAAYNGYVYMANIPGSQTNISNHTQLIYYRADAATGELTQVDTSDAGVGTNGDSSLRRLQVNSDKNVMYGVFQYTISTYSLSSSGLPSFVGSATPSTDSVWGFDFMPNGPYAYAAIQNGNPKQGFQTPQIVLMNIASDGSLSVNRPVATLANASGIAGYLNVDPTGKYVVVTNGQQNDHLSVFAIQGDGSLQEVPGSPFAAGEQNLGLMAFDSSGKFLYVVSNELYQPQGENLQVFSFNASTGALAQVQNITEPNEVMESWLKVDGNFVYLTNVAGTALSSTITVYNRDSNTGMLTQASNTTVQSAIAQTETLHF